MSLEKYNLTEFDELCESWSRSSDSTSRIDFDEVGSAVAALLREFGDTRPRAVNGASSPKEILNRFDEWRPSVRGQDVYLGDFRTKVVCNPSAASQFYGFHPWLGLAVGRDPVNSSTYVEWRPDGSEDCKRAPRLLVGRLWAAAIECARRNFWFARMIAWIHHEECLETFELIEDIACAEDPGLCVNVADSLMLTGGNSRDWLFAEAVCLEYWRRNGVRVNEQYADALAALVRNQAFVILLPDVLYVADRPVRFESGLPVYSDGWSPGELPRSHLLQIGLLRPE